MPLYEVRVERIREETITELWQAFRDSYYEVVYEVEAESEEEARRIVLDGDGNEAWEDWVDDGETTNTEYVETLDVVDSNIRSEKIIEVEEIENGIPEPDWRI